MISYEDKQEFYSYFKNDLLCIIYFFNILAILGIRLFQLCTLSFVTKMCGISLTMRLPSKEDGRYQRKPSANRRRA